MPSIPGYLTVSEAAKKLRKSKESVRLYCRAGKIKSYAHGPAWLIPVAAIETFTTNKPGRPRRVVK